MGSTGRQAARSAATREALLAVAREQFGARGFAATTVEDVAAAAGVTKGAVYHHFGGKDELFRAVYERLEAELAGRCVEAARRGRSGLGRLRRGVEAYLDACAEPPVQQVLLLDGLSVLGWREWHALGTRYTLAVLRAGLEGAIASGELRPAAVDPLAHLLQGALIQAGMVLARAEDQRAARRLLGRELGALLEGLRA